MEEIPFSQSYADNESLQLFRRYDFRLFAFENRRLWWLMLLLFILVVLPVFFAFDYLLGKSMQRWQSQARLFHQIRSERVPSFYKQMDTKVIAEFASSGLHLMEVSNRLHLPPAEAAQLFRLVTIDMNRNKPNIIIITASYNNPNLAAEIANALADVVLSAYVDMQNSTLREMLDQRQQRRLRLQADLARLETASINFVSPDSFLNPEQELQRYSGEIVDAITKLETARVESLQIQAVIDETERLLQMLPEEVPYLRRIRTTDSSAVDLLQNTLEALRVKYTESNPRVMALADEVAGARQRLEEAVGLELQADEEVFIRNQVRYHLEESKHKAIVQLAGLDKVISARAQWLETAMQKAPERLKLLSGFLDNQRSRESLQVMLNQLDVNINDMELLLNSAVPDLSVLEYAVPAAYPNNKRAYLVLLAAVAGGAVVFLFLLARFLSDFVFGRVNSPRAFNLGANFNFLGLLPLKSQVSAKEMEASTQRVFLRLRHNLGQGRRIFLSSLSTPAMTAELKASWYQNFGVAGHHVFWLSLLPPNVEPQELGTASSAHRQAIDDKLVAIEKSGNRGLFRCSNSQVLAQAEIDLLNADLATLEGNFNMFVLEYEGQIKLHEQIFAQLCQQTDYTVLTAVFKKDRKSALAYAAAGNLAEHQIGCVLAQVDKRYLRLLQQT